MLGGLDPLQEFILIYIPQKVIFLFTSELLSERIKLLEESATKEMIEKESQELSTAVKIQHQNLVPSSPKTPSKFKQKPTKVRCLQETELFLEVLKR